MARLLHFDFFFILCISIAHSWAAFTPADNYLIDCGATNAVNLDDGRRFETEGESSSFLTTSFGDQSITVSTSNATVPSALYMTARVIIERAFYSFEIKQQGRHWVRLYLYPVPDKTHDLKSAVFSVTTDNFVLLHDFTFKGTQKPYLFKEYLINVTWSLAFVNAIEVVSAPDGLIPERVWAFRPPENGHVLSGLALETVYRINMGGPKIDSKEDTLWRVWEPDQKYLEIKTAAQSVSTNPSFIKYNALVSLEIAPPMVYATAEEISVSA
jgi:hypothetical protein